MTTSPDEARHLDIEPYDEDQRVDPPDWYDDDIDVGDVTNAEAEGVIP